MSEKQLAIEVSWFARLLTIALVALKLTDAISISWIWVLSPLWIPFAAVGVIFAAVVILSLISMVLNLIGSKR